jgi:uncharacterized Zn-binding protein involved in type VI secretion
MGALSSHPAARGSYRDQVLSQTGDPFRDCCEGPIITSTSECSKNVIINGYGAVRFGDRVKTHLIGCGECCGLDRSQLDTGAFSVFVNKRHMGRMGDHYTVDNQIISGSLNVLVTTDTYNFPGPCGASQDPYDPEADPDFDQNTFDKYLENLEQEENDD